MELPTVLKPSATGWVFTIYAVVAWSVGLVLFGLGPIWLGVDLPGLPFYKASLVRVAGGIMMAAGCFAAALIRVEDAEMQRRGFIWFGIAHIVLTLVLVSQQAPIWGSPLADRIIFCTFMTGVAFFFLAFGDSLGSGEGPFLQTLFSRPETPTGTLRSRYKRQIREAALQEERHRLARDLHDSVKQQIFAIQTSAATAQARFESDPTGTRAALDQVRASAREAMAEMEAMLDQLRAAPLENAGLVEAIKKQCEALGFRTAAKVEFEVGELPNNLMVPPGAQQALFRVAQEALANVARHARASHVHVQLGIVSGFLQVSIEDDGAGFDPAQASRGMGLANMRARSAEFGGRFDLTSSPGRGARIAAAVPLTPLFDAAQYRNRLWLYGGAVAGFLAAGFWRHSGVFYTMATLFTIHFVRTLMARADARRSLEGLR